MIEDFLYICDGAYNSKELVRMEMSILKVMDYDLGIPLSYRFLRRYARVCINLFLQNLRKFISISIYYMNYIIFQ